MRRLDRQPAQHRDSQTQKILSHRERRGRTPHIDRIANEGIRFLHYYGEQSCTAGRAAFLTGQHGIPTGLTKVGFPGAPMGMSQLDPSIGGLLKSLGYATGQFGKNHVGDRDETLPTVNGLDEFFGNLYHLNAEEEPELPDYPKDPAYRQKFGPRGVLRCKATDRDDPTVDPRFGKIGKQTIEDTGALTKKRMESIDDETSAAVIDYMKRQHAAGQPFLVWYNSTRMHLRTHVRAEHRGRYTHGDSEYIDGMIEHDETVGTLLKCLDDLGIADNTIVVYSTDNGPHMDEVFKFVESIKAFPPRSFPPSFNPANILEGIVDDMKEERRRVAEQTHGR
jgi:arylsulfatase